jgi:hypothetical protein
VTRLLAALLGAVLSQPPGPASIPVRVIDRGAASLIEEARTTVVSSQEQFAALWREHTRRQPLPAVDFSRETVIAVFLGTRNTAGYSVDIVGVDRGTSAVTVSYRERTPAADSVTAQVLTFPFVIAAIPRADGPVRFEPVR